jgi:hypothetical protein
MLSTARLLTRSTPFTSSRHISFTVSSTLSKYGCRGVNTTTSTSCRLTLSKKIQSSNILIGPSYRQVPAHNVRRLMSTSVKSNSTSVMDKVLWFPRTYPFIFQALFATGKTAISDLVVQISIEKKDEIDWKRTAVFAAFGFGYLGMAQWFFYVTCMKRLFPNMGVFATKSLKEKLKDGPGLKALAGQVAFDNFVVTPFFYFPFFYVFKQSIQGDFNFDAIDPVVVLQDAWSKYKFNMKEDLQAMWSLWIPGDIFIYAIPIWMRLPANHILSLFWTMVLSMLRGDAIDDGGGEKKAENEIAQE